MIGAELVENVIWIYVESLPFFQEKAILAKKKLGGAALDDSDMLNNHIITEYMVPGTESNSQEKVDETITTYKLNCFNPFTAIGDYSRQR